MALTWPIATLSATTCRGLQDVLGNGDWNSESRYMIQHALLRFRLALGTQIGLRSSRLQIHAPPQAALPCPGFVSLHRALAGRGRGWVHAVLLRCADCWLGHLPWRTLSVTMSAFFSPSLVISLPAALSALGPSRLTAGVGCESVPSTSLRGGMYEGHSRARMRPCVVGSRAQGPWGRCTYVPA